MGYTPGGSLRIIFRENLSEILVSSYCADSMVLFGLVLWHINHCRLFNAKSIFNPKNVLFQTIQLNISTQFSSI